MQMVKKLRVGLIFGGRSGEHDVSLMSARSLIAAIDPDKYAITQIGISHDGAWLVGDNVLDALELSNIESLSSAALIPDPTRRGVYSIQSTAQGEILQYLGELDVVFPIMHGTFGEDGSIQGLCELADLAYVGAGVLGSALGMDKVIFKTVMRAHGIPVVDWIVATRAEIQHDVRTVANRALDLGDFPLFVKPANLGSSVGVTRCMSTSDLMEGLYDAARFDRRILIERGVPNPHEIEVSVLGNDLPVASIPGEILPSRNYYSYESKYLDGTSKLLIPAPISAELTHRIQSLAIQAYRAIDCAGMARVDFLIADGEGDSEELYLGEINTIPGFTQISMYPKLWEHSGLSYPALIDRLIDLALERKIERDRTERRFHRES
jgi:D-alanine-D-alanine ligase